MIYWIHIENKTQDRHYISKINRLIKWDRTSWKKIVPHVHKNLQDRHFISKTYRYIKILPVKLRKTRNRYSTTHKGSTFHFENKQIGNRMTEQIRNPFSTTPTGSTFNFEYQTINKMWPDKLSDILNSHREQNTGSTLHFEN